MLLHGVSDTHLGVSGVADFLVAAGYGALLPDSRGHGRSIPALATYGLKEIYDVQSWVTWLSTQSGCHRIYGFGASMGGAILLESLAIEKRFDAVIADFPSIARFRIDQRLPIPATFANLISAPVIFSAFTYGRLRYRLDLATVSPIQAVRQTTVPSYSSTEQPTPTSPSNSPCASAPPIPSTSNYGRSRAPDTSEVSAPRLRNTELAY